MDLKQHKELVGSYQRVFKGGASAKDCQRVWADLEKRAFIKETTFSESHGRMGFNEGRRSFFMHITSMVETDLDKLTELPREYPK